MLLATFLVGAGTMFIANRFLFIESKARAMEQLWQTQAYYELILNEMDSLNLMFSTNPEIINQIQKLLGKDVWDWADYRDIRTIRSYISAPANARPYIESIYVYLENDRKRVLTSIQGLISMELMGDVAWYETYMNIASESEFHAEAALSNQYSNPVSEKKVLRIYRNIYNTSHKRIGVIVLNLLEERLVSDFPLSDIYPGQSISVMRDDGTELFSLPAEQSRLSVRNPVQYSISSPRFGWIYSMELPRSYLYRLSNTIGLLTLFLSVLVCALGLVITNRANRKERRFLQNILERLEAAGASSIEEFKQSSAQNIFDYLNQGILKTFIEQDYLKIQKEAMEYRALQTQINPHFLFNTLETINWRAIKLLNGPNDLSRMIHLLSRILKYAIQGQKPEGVSLEEELQHTRYYLELQAIRFPGRFSLEWDIEDTVLKQQVPRLILQPLLENCFNHAFSDEESCLQISISIHAQDNAICIRLRDNGRGIPQDILRKLDQATGTDNTEHIGLTNVRKRLRLFYDTHVEFSILSPRDAGTEIIMLLPQWSIAG